MLVPLNVFKQLRKFADRESSRYALGGILFERSADGSPVAVATDGRRMVAFTWIEPDDENQRHPLAPVHHAAAPGWQMIVSGEAIAQVCAWKLDRKALALRPILGYIYVDEHGAAEREPGEKEDPADIPRLLPIGATDGTARYAIDNARLDGRFPKWRDVYSLPPQDAVSITLDPRYLAEACDVARELATSPDSVGVDVMFSDPEKPARVDVSAADGSRVSCVIMPLARDDERGEPRRLVAELWQPAQNPTMAQHVRHELARLVNPGQSFDVESDGADWRLVRIVAPDLGIVGAPFVARDLLPLLRSAAWQPGDNPTGAAQWREYLAGHVASARAPQAGGEPAAVEPIGEPAAAGEPDPDGLRCYYGGVDLGPARAA